MNAILSSPTKSGAFVERRLWPVWSRFTSYARVLFCATSVIVTSTLGLRAETDLEVGVKILKSAKGNESIDVSVLASSGAAFNPYSAAFTAAGAIIGAINEGENKAWQSRTDAKLDEILSYSKAILNQQQAIREDLKKVSKETVDSLHLDEIKELENQRVVVYGEILNRFKEKKRPDRWSKEEKLFVSTQRLSLETNALNTVDKNGYIGYSAFIQAALAARHIGVITDAAPYQTSFYSEVATKLDTLVTDCQKTDGFIDKASKKVEMHRNAYTALKNSVSPKKEFAFPSGSNWTTDVHWTSNDLGTVENPIQMDLSDGQFKSFIHPAGNPIESSGAGVPQARDELKAIQNSLNKEVADFTVATAQLKNLRDTVEQIKAMKNLFLSWKSDPLKLTQNATTVTPR